MKTTLKRLVLSAGILAFSSTSFLSGVRGQDAVPGSSAAPGAPSVSVSAPPDGQPPTAIPGDAPAPKKKHRKGRGRRKKKAASPAGAQGTDAAGPSSANGPSPGGG